MNKKEVVEYKVVVVADKRWKNEKVNRKVCKIL